MKAFLDVDGKRVFCPAAGSGESVVLMHGGGANHESWGAQFPVLSQHYRVYAPDRPGHGRTADSDWEWTPDNVADHTARMLAVVDDGPYALVGWSDGAVIALRVALRHPELVSKLVLIGNAFTRAGEPRKARAFIEGELRGGGLVDGMREAHGRLSPDGPDHFDVVLAKLQALWDTPDELAFPDDLAAIHVPTLVMQGDDDGVTFEHSAAVARTVQDGEFCVVPGTGHALPVEKPDIVNAILLDFLGGPRRPRMFPLGSLHDL